MHSHTSRPSRRAFLAGAGTAVGAGLAAGCGAPAAPPPLPGRAGPTGVHQAGIADPPSAQPHLLAVVADVVDTSAGSPVRGPAVGGLLADLGQAVLDLVAGTEPRLLGLPPGDLTVTVGIGPRLVRLADPGLPGGADLPPFDRERIAPTQRGGDLLLQVCASDALLLPTAAGALLARAGDRVRERWRQSGRRGPGVALDQGRAAPRNLLGFVDGIVGPRTGDERRRDLWLAGPASVAGGTIAVLRRMEVDLQAFAALPLPQQEAVFGRRRDSGVPLSGGSVSDGPDLGAKTPDGRYVVPATAHARRAHATLVGVGLMLRRSYSIDDPAPGLLFVSFQNDVRTFVATMASMQSSDALLGLTTTTASATFLMLPGFDTSRPLGSTLFPVA